MKVIIEFDDKDDHFQKSAAKRALNADNAYIALNEINELLRKDNCLPLDLYYTLLEKNDINLDDLE